LVAARVPGTDKDRYEGILDRGAVDVRVRAVAHRKAGWKSYDPSAVPYTREEIERERKLHGR
jgi:hypothetical protein